MGLDGLTFLLVIQATHASIGVVTKVASGGSIGGGVGGGAGGLGTGVDLVRKRSHSNDFVILVNHLEVVAGKEVGDGRKLGTIAGAVVVQLK